MGFITRLLRPIGLLNDEVREGRRPWSLPSPFLDPLWEKHRLPISRFSTPTRIPFGDLGTLSYIKGKILWVWRFVDRTLGNRPPQDEEGSKRLCVVTRQFYKESKEIL